MDQRNSPVGTIRQRCLEPLFLADPATLILHPIRDLATVSVHTQIILSCTASGQIQIFPDWPPGYEKPIETVGKGVQEDIGFSSCIDPLAPCQLLDVQPG